MGSVEGLEVEGGGCLGKTGLFGRGGGGWRLGRGGGDGSVWAGLVGYGVRVSG